MSLPYPPYPPGAGMGRAAQPGIMPLRPLDVGEILVAGFTVARRRLGLLAGIALLTGLLSSATTWALVAANGELDSYASGSWLEEALVGANPSIAGGILLGSFAGLAVGSLGAELIAGVAAPVAGNLAIGRAATGVVRTRLAGRWPALLGCAAVVGLAATFGLLLLVVPGVIVLLVWFVAVPVVAMEGATVPEALRRSAALTRGHRARIFGIVVLLILIGLVASALVGGILGGTLPSTGFGASVAVEAVAILVGALIGAWSGAVQAVVYIDLRIRSEGLAPALEAAAAADRAAFNPPARPAG